MRAAKSEGIFEFRFWIFDCPSVLTLRPVQYGFGTSVAAGGDHLSRTSLRPDPILPLRRWDGQEPVPLKNETTPSLFSRVRPYRLFWFVALSVFLLDKVTKAWIASRLPLGSYGPRHHIPVLPGFFNLVHAGNTGSAWSMFTGMGTALGFLAVGTLVAIFFWRHELGLRSLLPQLSFGLLCGGTAGNLTDRLELGYVVDFLDFHFGSYIYPTFNVADIGIVVGVFSYILWSLRLPAERK